MSGIFDQRPFRDCTAVSSRSIHKGCVLRVALFKPCRRKKVMTVLRAICKAVVNRKKTRASGIASIGGSRSRLPLRTDSVWAWRCLRYPQATSPTMPSISGALDPAVPKYRTPVMTRVSLVFSVARVYTPFFSRGLCCVLTTASSSTAVPG